MYSSFSNVSKSKTEVHSRITEDASISDSYRGQPVSLQAKEWQRRSNRVNYPLDTRGFENCPAIILQPLASNDIVTVYMVENSEKSKQMKHAVKAQRTSRQLNG
jgi:hypothetical protein